MEYVKEIEALLVKLKQHLGHSALVVGTKVRYIGQENTYLYDHRDDWIGEIKEIRKDGRLLVVFNVMNAYNIPPSQLSVVD